MVELGNLCLDTRTRNGLNLLGVESITDLIKLTDKQILKTKNMGVKSLEVIKHELNVYGFCLDMGDLEELKIKISRLEAGLSRINA